jgi:hypothetical protein
MRSKGHRIGGDAETKKFGAQPVTQTEERRRMAIRRKDEDFGPWPIFIGVEADFESRRPQPGAHRA